MARKLFNASAVEPPTTKFCDPFCDNTKTAYGICPYMCNGFCPPLCVPLFETPAPPPPPPPPPPIAAIHKSHRLSLALTVSLSVLATAFFLFTCYTIYKLCSNWRRSRRSRSNRPEEDGGLADDFLDEEHGPIVDHPIWYIRTIGLQPSVISAITIVKYKTGDGLIEGTDCSVCLNEFEDGETLRLLPKCNHAFHIPCIDTWLRSHTNCPMCRAGIVNNAAVPLSSPEPVVHNSGLAEDNPLEMSENNIEVSENESSRGTEDDRVTRSQSGLKIDEDADRVLPMRRSVSFDSLSASMISAAVATAFAGQSDGNSDISKESTVENVAQQTAGSSNIQRSVSCSAKVFLSRHSSRNRNSQ